jgi:ATP-dependent helicase YprA (DUF1998 family)
MDVFALRERVVNDYKNYIESFVRIRDKQIDEFVHQQFASGALWPDPILQLNPAYEPGPTLDDLAAQGAILQDTAKFFRRADSGPIRLYKHQHEAIEIARKGEPYVVTTGTGSGKSLTYLIPIYDHILRNNPEKHQVRAIIVYPMNALINSQLKALQDYEESARGSLVRFERYTGQEKQEKREQILSDPPHILLTNYVMLEYMMLRPVERHLTSKATTHLEFLVLDELHTYRGRQGADVAMLLRRLRERTGNPNLLHIGTSATMATEGRREDRRRAVGAVATKLFGSELKPENVVDETLRPAIQVKAPEDGANLRSAVEADVPNDLANFCVHPLAAWVENTFGLDVEEGRLVRRTPIKFEEGVKRLTETAGLPTELCRQKLRAVLDTGNALKNEDGESVFAFRLHQFLAAGGTVYATLDPSDKRQHSLEGQYYAAGISGEDLLYPLVFCRDCGQEYYIVGYREGVNGKVTPRTPVFYMEDEDEEILPGYIALDEGNLWSDDRVDDLPDHWWETGKTERIKRDYKEYVPRKLFVQPDGKTKTENDPGATPVWFQPSPFLFCLRCGVAYERREKNDFRKLTRLSHTGRSTATTLIGGSTIIQLRQDGSVPDEARKLLSFTDNRQDASLQAGHFNDFIQVALVRSALYRALTERGSLDHAQVTQAVFHALDLKHEAYASQPSEYDPGKTRNEKAMQRLLEYRLYEDLRRGWRIVQPNLEQCGLVKIEYPGLADLCRNEKVWEAHPVLNQAKPERRERAIHVFLDHLRKEMAIDAGALDPQEEWELRQRVTQSLREPWAFDSDDYIRPSTLFVLPGSGRKQSDRDRSLDFRAKVSRFLRSADTWSTTADISPGDWESFIKALTTALYGSFLRATKTHTQAPAIQLLASAFEWRLGDGKPPEPDPIRSRRSVSEEFEEVEQQANNFFAELYRETARQLAGVEGQAHTGQVDAKDREQREQDFRAGKLAALFCSPTMELGIDIRELSVVHLRNIPPTPANYAQRSGRAGRGGQQALVVAFCSEGSSHDQYFFREPALMVAGAVAPPRLELANENLVKAHLHSVWLAETGIELKSSIVDALVIDDANPGFPLQADIQHRTQLSDEKRTELRDECLSILKACGPEVQAAFWNTPAWLDSVLSNGGLTFDRAFDRWRELYQAAATQRNEARKVMDNPKEDANKRKNAERDEWEAKREIELLENRSQNLTESDFYPYRYLAAEGFLPGYNFPRLPLRAMLPASDKTYVIDRPRFLGLREFGPRNILYHEGRKYRMARVVLPTGGVQARLKRAKFCGVCGYFHEGERVGADLCDHCKSTLDMENSEFIPLLFEMAAVKGLRVDRITCDEEERTREGYELELYYRFATGTDGKEICDRAAVSSSEGTELLRLTHAPQANLWRVNRKWRRSDQRGFSMDSKTGFWVRRPGDDDKTGEIDNNRLISGITPFVWDTRNLLLISPEIPAQNTGEDRESFLASLSYAIQRGCQIFFQVEEQEISVGRIGAKNQERILFWEASEGGSGVWPRLLEDSQAAARVAKEALAICHFDPSTGTDLALEGTCIRACYRCLLSYSNQMDHRLLNRFAIRDFLMSLQSAATARVAHGRTYEEQYQWLKERRDTASNLEDQFLDELHLARHRLPDLAQHRPEPGVYAEADFFYEREDLKGIAVFVDGPHHDEPTRWEQDSRERRRLEDMGYRVIVIRYDRPIKDQIVSHADVFGRGILSRPHAMVGAEPDPSVRVVNIAVEGASGKVRSDRTLMPGAEYFVLVHIGGQDPNSIVRNPSAIPDEALKPFMSTEGLVLRVVISSRDFQIFDEERTLTLPATGKSETIRFRVRTPVTVGIAQLRVVIYYEQNALQSLLITARVAKHEQLAHPGLGAEVEYCLCGTLKEIEMYPPRTLSILTNESTDGTHTFAVVGTDIREDFTFTEGELSESLKACRTSLLETCLELDKNGKPIRYRYDDKTNNGTQDQLTADLVKLASAGWDLYVNFVTHKSQAFEQRLRSALSEKSTIQIASVKSAKYVFPWALVYDKPLRIGSKNTVCPDFLETLKSLSGRLGSTDSPRALSQLSTSWCLCLPCRHINDPTIICPGGFWGFKHILEQPPSVPHEPGRQIEDVLTHLTVHGKVKTVMGVSLRLNNPETHFGDIGKLNRYSVVLAKNRVEIFNILRNEPSSNLIYFYCHGGKEAGKSFLGVGEDDRIIPNDLLAEGVSWPTSHPIVFINGCRTADLTPSDLITFVRMFVWCQASGVIGTEISIPESLATEFATGILDSLASKGSSIGSAILDQRHLLLAKCNPLGLVYTPYCHASLQFEFQQ